MARNWEKHPEVFFYLESLGFGLQVVWKGHLNTTSGNAEGGIFNGLELGYLLSRLVL